MLEETVILDSNECLNEIFRNIGIFNPDIVLSAVKTLILYLDSLADSVFAVLVVVVIYL